MSLIFISGFFILLITTLVLFSYSFIGVLGIDGTILILFLKVLMIATLLYMSKLDWIERFTLLKEKVVLERGDLFNFIAVILGGLLTFYLSINIGLGGVLASGLVGTIAALILSKYDLPIFCGSFVGMASNGLFISYWQVVLASAFAGIVFVIGKYAFNGFGGKLGTAAFAGSLVSALLTGGVFLENQIPSWDIGWMLVIYSIIGAVLTRVIAVRFDNSAVMSSGIVGLIAALLLPIIHPEVGAMLAVAVFGASFAGMSSTDRIANEGYMAIAGLFCALIFIYSSPYLGGAGGKLGTTAFASVISLNGMLNLLELIKAKKEVRVGQEIPSLNGNYSST